MPVRRRARAVGAVAASALLLAACSGGGDGDGAGGEGTADGGAEFSVNVGEPQNALVPGNTTESEGSEIVGSLWTGLVQYDNETAEVEYTGVAESVESDDSTTWTITLKDGWTFHDGTPVTAQSFVDAWNYTALSTNAQAASSFFANVAGYDDLQAQEGAEPAATQMSGLDAVDDATIRVTLSSPFTQFPLTLGYNPFFPLPQAFFDDPEGFGEQPVGNGPFRATEPFVPGEGITLARYDDYAGEEPAQSATVEYRIYNEIGTAYTDVQAGALDIMVDLPPDVAGTAPEEFADRYLERPSADYTYLGFPLYDPRYADVRVRRALTMAVDREAITEAIFAGTRTPATSLIAPPIDGHREGACADCTLDVEQANTLLDEAGFDRSQSVELWFNAGQGHEEWMQAVGNQLRQNLGVDYTLRGDLQFAEYLPLGANKGFTGPFRLGWGMDYPSPQNYLQPLYSTAAQPPAGANRPFYSNPEFDRLITEANAAQDNATAIELYQQAEDLVLADMPVMPMFYGVEQGVFSDRVGNVQIDPFGRVDAASVTVTG